MGTRSNTIVVDGKSKLINMYRQFDGYPSGHGKELFEFLNQFTMVNGLGFQETRKVANGAGCLAALLVSHFKGDAPGSFYLEPPACKPDNDYAYIVKLDTFRPQDGITVEVLGYDKKVFEGSLKDFGVFCDTEEE